jgi:hypothetical protein
LGTSLAFPLNPFQQKYPLGLLGGVYTRFFDFFFKSALSSSVRCTAFLFLMCIALVTALKRSAASDARLLLELQISSSD